MKNKNYHKSTKFSVDCEAGHYRDADTVECHVCKDNTVSEAGAAICTDCAEGTEANSNKTQCGKLIIIQF